MNPNVSEFRTAAVLGFAALTANLRIAAEEKCAGLDQKYSSFRAGNTAKARRVFNKNPFRP
jgi:hypothetical protein